MDNVEVQHLKSKGEIVFATSLIHLSKPNLVGRV